MPKYQYSTAKLHRLVQTSIPLTVYFSRKNDYFIPTADYHHFTMEANFGEQIRSLRGKYRMTQKEVAARLGMQQRQYSRLEQKITPPAKATLQAIADLYRMKIDELLAYDPGSIKHNSCAEQKQQKNSLHNIVINGLDDIVKEAMSDEELLHGKQLRLTVTLKLEKG